MPYGSTHRKLIFDTKFIILEHSVDLLRILKHLYSNLGNNKINFSKKCFATWKYTL